jgi:hypothetical protein
MKNFVRVFLVLALAGAITVVATGAISPSSAHRKHKHAKKHKRHHKKRTAAKRTTTPTPTGPSLFGFNDNSVLFQQTDPATAIARSAAAGANVVRYTVNWDYVEPLQGEWNWRGYDPLYENALQKGIRPILVAAFSPAWTRPLDLSCGTYRAHCHNPPASKFDWAWVDFIHQLARRYPKAAAIEVWNEPNLTIFWRQGPDQYRYAHLLNLAYQAVKEVNPDMTVLGGALNNSQISGNGAVAYEQFTRDVLALKPRFDAWSLHDYYTSGSSSDWFDKTLDIARSALDVNGFGDRQLWVTELGVTTAGAHAVPVTDQGPLLVDQLKTLGARADVKSAVVHTLVPAPVDPSSDEYGFAVMAGDGTPKPAYCTLATARLAPAPSGCPS